MAQQFRLAFAARPHVGEAAFCLAPNRKHVIRSDKDFCFTDAELVFGKLDYVQDDEQGLAILLDFRPLMTVLRVFHCKLVQPEFTLHNIELFRLWVFERDPDKAVRPAQILMDLPDSDVGQLAAVLIGCAIDEHGFF